MAGAQQHLFGDVALERRFITATQLEAALSYQREKGVKRPIGEVLVELGFITHSQVSAILKLQRVLYQIDQREQGIDPAAELRGQVLGGCLILDQLGKGAMGTTFKAHHLRLDRDVALKVLHPELVKDRRTLDRFTREARAAAKLEHPGVVTVYDFDEEGPWSFIVMQYVEGKSLREVLDERGPLGPKHACWVTAKVAEALHAAHELKIVHRDVKPANVMISKAGAVKLTDFGLVRVIDGTKGDGPTSAFGELIGTPHYMSPEQSQASSDIDARSDIYGLGIMAFELICGKIPFESKNLIDLLKKHILEPLPSLRDRVPDCPPALEEVIRRCCEKRPENRWPDAATVARELKRVQRTCFGPSDDSQGARHVDQAALQKEALAVPALAEVPTSAYDVQEVRETAAQAMISRALEGDLPGALRDLTRFGPDIARDLTGRLLGSMLSAGRVDEVLREEPEVRALAARVPVALFYLARAYQTKGRLIDSISILTEAWKKDRDDVELAHELASVLAATGRKEEAERVVNALIAWRATDPKAFKRAAEVRYVALGDLTGAAAAYGRAADLEPTAFEARQQQGFLLLELGKNAEAVKALEDAVRRAPDAALAHLLLGRARSLVGDHDGSRKAFARALELDKGAHEARVALIRHALDDKKWVDAVRLAQDGLERSRDDVDLGLALGAAREGQGEHRVAVKIYEALLQKHPKNEQAKEGLARARKRTTQGFDRPAGPS